LRPGEGAAVEQVRKEIRKLRAGNVARHAAADDDDR
jgi:hypothetical protein